LPHTNNLDEDQMVLLIRTYNSINEIAESMDKEIADTRSKLGEYLHKLDETRTLTEKSKKIRETVMKIAGKKNGHKEDSDEIEVGSVKIVVDANASHELAILESSVRSHQERLIILQNAREGLKSLDQLGDTEGLNFMVLENQGVPERVLLKTA
jgi:hypothetical protein